MRASQRRIDARTCRRLPANAIGGEGQVEQLVARAADRPEDLEAGRVADRDHAGFVGRREGSSIGREREGDEGSGVALRLQERAGFRVPEPHRLVVARRGEGATVRREGERANRVGVAGELSDAARRGRRPRRGRSSPCPSNLLLPPAEASVLPSGANATDRTKSWWPRSECSRRPVATSQSRTLSRIVRWPDARIRPSGENASEATVPTPPFQPRMSWPGGRIPELDRLGLVGVIAPGREDLAVGGVGRGPGLVLVAGGRRGIRRRIEVPDQGRSDAAQDQGATRRPRSGAGRAQPSAYGSTPRRRPVAVSQTAAG